MEGLGVFNSLRRSSNRWQLYGRNLVLREKPLHTARRRGSAISTLLRRARLLELMLLSHQFFLLDYFFDLTAYLRVLALQVLSAQIPLILFYILHSSFDWVITGSSGMLIPDLPHVFGVIDFENITCGIIIALLRTKRLFGFAFL